MRDLLNLIRFLYQRLSWRIFLWLLLILIAIGLESFSLGLFLPAITDSDGPVQRFAVSVFEASGVEFSLPTLLVAIIVIYGLRTAIYVLQKLYSTRLTADLMVAEKRAAVEQIFQVKYEFFISRRVSYFANAIIVELTNIGVACGLLAGVVAIGIFSLGYLTVAFVMKPSMTIVALAIAVPFYFLMSAAFRSLRRISLRNTENNSVLHHYISQMLMSFGYLRATESVSGTSRTAAKSIEHQGELMYSQARTSTLVENFVDFLLVAVAIGLLLYYTEVGGNTIAEAVFVLFIIRRAFTYGQRSLTLMQEFLALSGSVAVLHELRGDLARNRDAGREGGLTPDLSRPIRFENVSFGFNDSQQVLRDISLTIPPQKKVAIVGPSGAGKTTLVTLLTGILTPQAGTMNIGETPYEEIDLRAFRSRIGYVTQDPVIFNDTVRRNVDLWNDDDSSHDRVDVALEKAMASGFVSQMTHGADTLVGDRGVKLSGGQRQRIAIARELYRDCELLIMDESSSALDSENEKRIYENISQYSGEVTIVVVTHRLSTVRDADIIFVMDGGSLVEQGTYDELYRKGGIFTEMSDIQRLSESEAPAL